MLRMINEGYRVLGEKIAQRESDIDVATVMGIGFPDFHGGVLKHARDLGLRNVVSKLESRAEQCGARFAPCRLLQKLKGA